MPIGDTRMSAGIGPSKVSSESQSSSDERNDAQVEHAVEDKQRHIGSKASQPGGFWPKFWKHFKRYWLCYGIAGVVFLAIFLPVFFLVIIPAIAQRLVDDAAIPIKFAQVLQPTPDSITFSLSASLKVPLGLSVTIDPLDLSLFNREVKPMKPYITAPLGRIRLKGESAITVSNQTTKIRDQDEFIKFLSKAVYSKRFTLSAYGKTTAHLGKLKVPLKLDKDIELDGLDQLNGFSLDTASLVIPPKEDGSNLVGEATIPNHSRVTFALGNVTLALKIGDLVLGNGTIDNVLLNPGNNTIPLRGMLDIGKTLSNVATVLAAEADALSQLQVKLWASGQSVVANGLHLPYFEKVLSNLTVSTQVPILKVLIGSVSELIDSNPGVMSNVTEALRGTDLSSGPNM